MSRKKADIEGYTTRADGVRYLFSTFASLQYCSFNKIAVFLAMLLN